MSKRIDREHEVARALEEAAWDLKGLAERFHGRAMTAETARVLASAKRDVERIQGVVLGEWNRRVQARKRSGNGAPAEPSADDAQGGLELGGDRG